MKTRQVYIFGDFALDPTAKVLFKAGHPVHLARKAVETLLVLVENSGQVMTKEEIIKSVWGDRVVEEANLAQNIAVIRRALAAEQGSPAWIETFPGRGYRLEGPVSTSTFEHPVPLSHAEELPPPPSRSWWIAGASMAAVCCLALLLFFVWRSQPSAPTAPLRITPVTRLPGKEFQPAISSDGTRIAFLWSRSGASPPAIWVRTIAEGSPRELLPGGGHHSSPAWSPDGQRLAFLRVGRAASEAVIAEPASGSQRVLAALSPPDYGYDFRLLDWSPDGSSLAVSHSDGPDRPLAISLIALLSGERRSLTRPPENVLGDVDPRFSPDGKTMSFIRLIHRFHQEVYSVPLTGGQPVKLTSFGKQVSGHDWEPGGDSIVFASDRSGEFRLWRMRFPPVASGQPTPVGVYGEFPIQVALARNASELVYSVLRQDRNIWRLDLAAKSWERVVASTGQDASPQYSPAGDLISFRSDRSGEEQLWTAKSDGADPAQITSGTLHPSVGRWSPDGRAIVFNNPQTAEIHIASLSANGNWSVQPAGGTGVHPVFSRDGKWIYAGGPSGITRLPVAGGTATSIAKIRSLSLDISPDGHFLYFVREPIDTSLWRLNLSTLTPEKVFDGLVPGCTSCWALALDGVYYLGTGRESLDTQLLYFHDFKTGQDRVILPYPEPLWPLGSGPFALSPDRRSLLCVRMDPSDSDIMLATPARP